ncbi:MAG: hypothetical protein AMXMBFR7_19310 [Planctomycetota bacterium]
MQRFADALDLFLQGAERVGHAAAAIEKEGEFDVALVTGAGGPEAGGKKPKEDEQAVNGER